MVASFDLVHNMAINQDWWIKKVAKKIYRLLYVRRDVDMDKKIKYRITNIDELAKKLKKAQALSEELASVLKEIDEFKAKIRFDE
ncbi:hypothetical protein ABB44_07970 [Companilactobacillus farciminis]|nr:hypothetical protein ABB45_07950 [Companilactobacillus farciminis]AKS51854.1 hypothetical protein ABB44_07970 [Companilactobacillus farciminis]